jgi:hypothetical protein
VQSLDETAVWQLDWTPIYIRSLDRTADAEP